MAPGKTPSYQQVPIRVLSSVGNAEYTMSGIFAILNHFNGAAIYVSGHQPTQFRVRFCRT